MNKPIGTYEVPEKPAKKTGIDGLIQKGKLQTPLRAVIYGPEGLGKSPLAAMFPDPIFIDWEDSTDDLEVDRIKISSYDEGRSVLTLLLESPRDYKTIIIDTIDWVEVRMAEQISHEAKVDSLAEIGYNRGYDQLADGMFRFVNMLKAFSEDHGMNIVLCSHSSINPMELPDQQGSYQFYTLDLHKKVLPVVKEWADMILFVNWQTKLTNKEGDTKGKDGKKKAIGGEHRIIYTEHRAGFDAKNRKGLPAQIEWRDSSTFPLADLFPDTIKAPVANAPVATKAPAPVEEVEEQEIVNPEEEALIVRVRNAEKFLKENKVQHYIKGEPTVQRWNVTDKKILEDMNDEELAKYLDHLTGVARRAGLFEEEAVAA